MRASRLITYLVLATFFVGFFLFQITSCTKSVDAVTLIKKDTVYITKTDTVFKCPASIQGLWIGTYTVDGQSSLGEQYFSFIIKPDGSIVADTKGANQQHLSNGTWSLNGTTLSCSFTCVYGVPSNVGITETTTATWDNANKLTGTWKNVAPLTGSGTIKLTKVN